MLKNMKIIYKVTLLSAILLIFSGIIGITSYLFTKNSRENLSSMYNVDLKAITLTDDLRLQARSSQFALTKYMLDDNVENRTKLIKEMNDKMNNAMLDIEEYKGLDVPDKLMAEMILIEESYNTIKDFPAEFVEMASSTSVSDDQLKEYVLTTASKLDEFRSSANALMKLHIENTDQTYLVAEKANRQSITIALVMLVIALVFGILLTLIIVRPIISSLKIGTKFLGIIATGDFTQEISPKVLKSKDEVGDMLRAVDTMQKSIRDALSSVVNEASNIESMITKTDQNMLKLTGEIEEVSATTEQLSAGMEETAAYTQQVNSTSIEIQDAITSIESKAEETALSSNEISNRANEVKSKANLSKQIADEIYNSTNKNLRDAIEKSKAVNQINELLDAILEVTRQTNLLALNAAIEAARAGEAGRGFAVVADEIRQLAENSGNTVNKIQEVTQTVLHSVENLTESSQEILGFVDKNVATDYVSMVKTGEQYDIDAKSIFELSNNFSISAKQVGELITSIVESMNEITLSSNEGAESTAHIAEKTTNVAMMVSDITKQTKSMKDSVDILSRSVTRFKI